MRLEVLIGMIASGKSTYARKRADEGALVISHDDLTQMLHATYRYEPGLRKCYKAMMREIAHAAFSAQRDVVADRTHLTREARAFWVNLPSYRDVEVVAVTFPITTPEEHARRRFAADDRGRTFAEWLKVAERHAEQAQAEPLDWKAEEFDAIVEMP